jgi:hypothetical protein
MTYVAGIEPLLCCDWGLDDPAVKPMRAGFQAILDRTFAQKRIKLRELQNELQAVVAKYVSIPWVGTFQDLCHGKGEFAAEVVERFLDEEDQPKIIPADKIPTFIEFIREYGL